MSKNTAPEVSETLFGKNAPETVGKPYFLPINSKPGFLALCLKLKEGAELAKGYFVMYNGEMCSYVGREKSGAGHVLFAMYRNYSPEDPAEFIITENMPSDVAIMVCERLYGGI